jgi:hypothetical protein
MVSMSLLESAATVVAIQGKQTTINKIAAALNPGPMLQIIGRAPHYSRPGPDCPARPILFKNAIPVSASMLFGLEIALTITILSGCLGFSAAGKKDSVLENSLGSKFVCAG